MADGQVLKEGETVARIRYGHGPHDYAGVHEAAEFLGVSKQCFVNWRERYPDKFPEPVAHLKMGPIYQLHKIAAWARCHGLGEDER